MRIFHFHCLHFGFLCAPLARFLHLLIHIPRLVSADTAPCPPPTLPEASVLKERVCAWMIVILCVRRLGYPGAVMLQKALNCPSPWLTTFSHSLAHLHLIISRASTAKRTKYKHAHNVSSLGDAVEKSSNSAAIPSYMSYLRLLLLSYTHNRSTYVHPSVPLFHGLKHTHINRIFVFQETTKDSILSTFGMLSYRSHSHSHPHPNSHTHKHTRAHSAHSHNVFFPSLSISYTLHAIYRQTQIHSTCNGQIQAEHTILALKLVDLLLVGCWRFVLERSFIGAVFPGLLNELRTLLPFSFTPTPMIGFVP